MEEARVVPMDRTALIEAQRAETTARDEYEKRVAATAEVRRILQQQERDERERKEAPLRKLADTCRHGQNTFLTPETTLSQVGPNGITMAALFGIEESAPIRAAVKLEGLRVNDPRLPYQKTEDEQCLFRFKQHKDEWGRLHDMPICDPQGRYCPAVTLRPGLRVRLMFQPKAYNFTSSGGVLLRGVSAHVVGVKVMDAAACEEAVREHAAAV